MLKKLKATIQKTIEFVKSPRGETIRYIFIGGCTTLVDYVTFFVMDSMLHIDVTVSNVTSTALAICFAYVTNKYFVFQSRTSSLQELVTEFFKFIGSRLATMLLEIGGVFLFVNILGQDSNLGKAEAIILVIVSNYFLSKFLVFRKNKETQEQ